MFNFLSLRLAMGYDRTFFQKSANSDHAKAREIIGKIVTHAQALYHHPSLGTRITLDTPLPIQDLSGSINCNRGADRRCLLSARNFIRNRNLMKKMGNAQAITVIAANFRNIPQGYARNAVLGRLGHDFDKISVSTYYHNPSQAGIILAHEIGHNLGMLHDGDNCLPKGPTIMKQGAFGTTWSDCNVKDVVKHYNSYLKAQGVHPLDRQDPKIVGEGSWTNWYYTSTCNQACSGTRQKMRICIGFNCPGNSEGEDPCTNKKFYLLSHDMITIKM